MANSIENLLHEAELAVKSIDKHSLADMKAYMYPPELVAEVGNCICIIFQKDPSWECFKRLASQSTFLKSLLEYDKSRLDSAIFHSLDKHLHMNPDLKAENMKKISLTAVSLLKWCQAIYEYAKHVV